LLRTLYLVDLPGYGYANVSKSVREQWGPMIEQYLVDRSQLNGVLLLVDARVVTAHDRNAAAWLRSLGREVVVVTTKMDKVPRGRRSACLRESRRSLNLDAGADLIGYSSVTHEGRDEVWQAILKLVRGKE
jgi:GTP-binding protein